MKKMILLALFGLFLVGCAAPHSPTWKNWDHFKFSAWGYRNPSAETGQMSQAQAWWGEEIPYIPAE